MEGRGLFQRSHVIARALVLFARSNSQLDEEIASSGFRPPRNNRVESQTEKQDQIPEHAEGLVSKEHHSIQNDEQLSHASSQSNLLFLLPCLISLS